jgi:hypothetical protein
MPIFFRGCGSIGEPGKPGKPGKCGRGLTLSVMSRMVIGAGTGYGGIGLGKGGGGVRGIALKQKGLRLVGLI